MKNFVLLILVSITILNASAGDNITVSLVKQYDDTSFVLPKKAIEKKLKSVTIKNKKYDFTKKLMLALDKIQDLDYGNNVFTVLLNYYGKGITIELKSNDILDTDTLKYFGDIIIERKHFLLIENEDNHDLLNTYFKKSSTNVMFQRLFEHTDNIVTYEPSSFNALYNEKTQEMVIKENIINGENLMKKEDTKKPIIIDNKDEGDDAFKLDVELFE